MAQTEAIKEVNAVVGYLPDAVAKALIAKGQHSEVIEVKLDRGKENEMLVRIKSADAAGVVLGASQNGETAVQVFLKEGASVETFTRTLASDFLRPIKDLTFIKLRPPINSIYVRPQFIDKIVQSNREDVT
jgi:hypothetical protein